MKLLETMDQLFDSAQAHGKVPEHWVVRESDWRETLLVMPVGHHVDAIKADSYRGIPVRFVELEEGVIVSLRAPHPSS